MSHAVVFLVMAQVSGKCSSKVTVEEVLNIGHAPALTLAVGFSSAGFLATSVVILCFWLLKSVVS